MHHSIASAISNESSDVASRRIRCSLLWCCPGRAQRFQLAVDSSPSKSVARVGYLPPKDVAATNICLPLKKTRTLEHQTTWKRLLVRTATRVEHQQDQITLDRVQNVHGLLGPTHENRRRLSMAPGHLLALPRPPHCPARRTTRQREQRHRSSKHSSACWVLGRAKAFLGLAIRPLRFAPSRIFRSMQLCSFRQLARCPVRRAPSCHRRCRPEIHET